MTAIYVDSSVVAAIAFRQSGHAELSTRLRASPLIWSAPLLEAEVRSAARREGMPVDEGWFDAIAWANPDRPLRTEIIRVLEFGYLRGADCWHLATALYLAQDPEQLTFLTLDVRQREVAAALGFST